MSACSVPLDGKHSWRFDGDDPYILCHWCGERRDALTGSLVAAGSRAGERAPTRLSGVSSHQPCMYEVVHEWLAENMPRALELCPYKARR